MSSAMDNNSVRAIAMEHCSTISNCGFTKPLPLLTTEDKIELVQAVSLHYVLLQSKVELDQFRDGLMTLGVLDAIKSYPNILCPFFTRERVQCLTAGT